MPLAYFITFSTYGTWLHGTNKGKGSVDDDHNQFGQPFVANDDERVRQSRDVMDQPPYTLDSPRRNVVLNALVQLASEKRWHLLAGHVRTNHVHAVITAERDPGRLMSDLKARASKELTRAGFDSADRKRWTRHGSTLHLFTVEQVEAKIHYTLESQGAPMALYDGRSSR